MKCEGCFPRDSIVVCYVPFLEYFLMPVTLYAWSVSEASLWIGFDLQVLIFRISFTGGREDQ